MSRYLVRVTRTQDFEVEVDASDPPAAQFVAERYIRNRANALTVLAEQRSSVVVGGSENGLQEVLF